MSYGQAENDQTQTIEHALEQPPLLNTQESEQPIQVDPQRVASIQFVPVEVELLSLPVEFLKKPNLPQAVRAGDQHLGRAAGGDLGDRLFGAGDPDAA